MNKIILLFIFLVIAYCSCQNTANNSKHVIDCSECERHYYSLDSINENCYECVEGVTLSMKDYEVIPDRLYNLVNIKYIDLKMNKIDRISQSITTLKKIERLHLRDNNLSSIPCFLSEIDSLKSIDFFYNKINQIPACLCDAPMLTEINLIGNPIDTLPKCFNKFLVLRE